jgi:hypothetical protein
MRTTTIVGTALVAALAWTQACSKDAQTDKAVETKMENGEMTASISGDSADKNGVALVRIVNAVPNSKELMIRADESRMLPMVAFQQVSAYQPIDKTWANFQVGDGSGATFVPLSSNREMLTDGHRYTVVVIRGEDGQAYETRVLRDVIENEPGKARVRVIHAAPGAGEVDLKAKTGEILFRGVDFSDDEGFKSVTPMTGALEVRANDGKTLVLTTPTVTLDAGKSYTVILSRTAAGKLDAFWFEDAQVN